MSMKNVKSLGARIAAGQKPKTQAMIDAGAIRELAELLSETGLSEIEIEQGGARIRVARQSGQMVAQGQFQPAPAQSASSRRRFASSLRSSSR